MRKRKQKLVLNSVAIDDDDVAEDTLTRNQLQSVTTNVTPKVRYELLEGRNYMVVPTVMITEGVHNGSNGPLYYPANELGKTPAVWNHKPIVVYHPQMNGQAVSACEPAVISRRKVGIILNTQYETGRNGNPGRLKCESWLEMDRLDKVDHRVLNSLKKGEMVEVSTGLFTDNESIDGLWKKEPFQYIARNYRPDHLAILPDEKGACSIADGAGLLRNSTGDNMTKKEKLVSRLIANEATQWREEDRDVLLTMNESLLRRMIPLAEPTDNFKHDPRGQDMIDDGGDDGTNEANDAESLVKPKKAPAHGQDAKNKFGGDDDDDEDDKSDVTMKTKPKRRKDEENEDEENVMNNSAKKPQTVEEFITNAPPEMQGVLRSGLHAHTRQKKQLVARITANENNRFNPEFLLNKSLEELELLAELAQGKPTQQPIANYAGMADVESPIDNSDYGDAEEPLSIPVLNFEKSA